MKKLGGIKKSERERKNTMRISVELEEKYVALIKAELFSKWNYSRFSGSKRKKHQTLNKKGGAGGSISRKKEACSSKIEDFAKDFQSSSYRAEREWVRRINFICIEYRERGSEAAGAAACLFDAEVYRCGAPRERKKGRPPPSIKSRIPFGENFTDIHMLARASIKNSVRIFAQRRTVFFFRSLLLQLQASDDDVW